MASRYNFIHVPKCAGQSLYSIACEHPDKIIFRGHVRALWNPYPNSFAFVRNPYDRLVSAYFYFVKHKDNPDHLKVAGKIIKKYPTFEKFVMGIGRDGLLMDDIPHIKPIYYWIDKKVKVFKIEDLRAIDNFLTSIGCGMLGQENMSSHYRYDAYLTPEIIAEINRLYARDFELFDYKML